jgi:hypothetical protein
LFNRQAKTIFSELGSWAVKFYLHQTLLALKKSQISSDLVQHWEDMKPQLLVFLSKHIAVPDLSQIDDLSMEQISGHALGPSVSSSAAMTMVCFLKLTGFHPVFGWLLDSHYDRTILPPMRRGRRNCHRK